MEKFDFIVIGAGRASNLAATLAKSGKKVAIIEKSTLGGTCANRGCVPSKLLLGYAHVAQTIKESTTHFIDASINNIDLEKIFKDTNEYIAGVESIYKKKFNDNVTLLRGTASFVSNKVIKVNDKELTAQKIIIATGTRPIEPEHEKAWTSDDIFPLKEKIPKSISIVGSGFIACELAFFFSSMNIETKLLIRSENILSKEDDEIIEVFKEQFGKIVDIEYNTSVKEVSYENEKFDLILEKKDKSTKKHSCEALLYAIGRESNADLLNLENTTIKTDDRGFIKRDEFFETTVKGVYVVGDAAGVYMLQHAAAYEMNHLGKYLLEETNEALEFKYMPHAVFTHPEIASVGITEKEAKEKGIKYIASTTKWTASAKAQATRIKYPITKLIIDPDNYEILGCHMIGPDSSTMIHQVLTIMHLNNDIRHLKEMLYIHPALSESLLPAAVVAIKKVRELKEDS